MSAATLDRRAWAFFHANAGGIVGQRAIGAAMLARAEASVASDAFRYRWESDDDADLSWMDDDERAREHEVEGCILERACGECGAWEHVASLWGIVDADSAYRRVVMAELACEVAS